MDGGDFQRKSADVEETPENAIGPQRSNTFSAVPLRKKALR